MEIKVLLPLSASAFAAAHAASAKQQVVAAAASSGGAAASSSSERAVVSLRVSPRATAEALYRAVCQTLALPAELARALYLFELDETSFGTPAFGFWFGCVRNTARALSSAAPAHIFASKRISSTFSFLRESRAPRPPRLLFRARLCARARARARVRARAQGNWSVAWDEEARRRVTRRKRTRTYTYVGTSSSTRT